VNISNIKFYVISTIIIIAGLYTVLTTSVYTLTPTDFGLVNRLPILYWVGLVSIGILFYTSRDSFNKSAFAFIFLIIFLFVIPAVVRVPGWLSNSYYPYANSLKVNDVKSSINLNQESDISTSYYYWPLFLFLASIVNITTYCNVELMLKFFPILTMIMISLLSYLIFKMKFNEIASIAGASLVLGSFWLRQQYYGPQAIAYIFFAFVLYVFSYILFKQINFRNEIYVIFVVFFVSILFTHLLTFGIIVFMLGSIFILNLVKHIENYKPLFYLTILSGIASAAYYLRGYLIPSSGGISTNYISWIISTLINSIKNITKLALFKESSRIQATPPQILNYYSTWIIVVLNGICIAYLLMTFILKRFDPKSILWENFSLFLVLFLACLGVLAVGLTYGPEESYQRAFMFGILPLVFFSLTQLSKHKKLLYITLFAIIILNVPAQYGSDNFRTATSTLMSGNKFFSDLAKSSTETTAINIDGLYSRYYNPDKHFEFSSIGTLPFTSLSTILKDQNTKLNNNKYLILSKAENNFYTFYLGSDPITRVNLNDYNITNYPVTSSKLNDIKNNYSQYNTTEFYTSRIYDNSGLQIIRLQKTYTVTSLMETLNGTRMLSSEQVLSGTHLSFNIPTSDQIFDHWEVDGANWGKAVTLNLTVNNSLFVNAVFQYTITITTSGEGNFTESPNSLTYPSNAQVDVYAHPKEGQMFSGWSGDSNSTIQDIKINMDSNKHLKAIFSPAYNITTDNFESQISRSNITDGTSSPLIGQFNNINDASKVAKYQTLSSYNSFTTYELPVEHTELYAFGNFTLAPDSVWNSNATNPARFYLIRFRSVGYPYNNSKGWLAGVRITNKNGVNNWVLFADNGGSSVFSTTSYEVVMGKWYSVELHWKQTDTNGIVEMFINGTLVSTLNLGNKNEIRNVKYIDIGISAANVPTDITAYADNVVISTGHVYTAR
jgi:hypothetical protein